MTTKVGAGLVTGRARKLLGDEGDRRLEAARKVLSTLGELKGAALKVGQTMALFSDQLPPEARQVISRLFSQAPTLPYAQIEAVLEKELGRPVREAFLEFEPTPFAGASLGQVHRARLPTGETVAVKVQYPGVEAALGEDFKNVQMIIRTVGMGGRLLDGRDYFDEIRREVTAELDYRRELAQLEEFRGFFSCWPDLVVPRAFPALSTGRVLVMELLEGPTLHEFVKGIDAVEPAERFAIGERLGRAILGPFLYHRVIHGDAHPGNFVVMSGSRLGVLDYGCAKHLPEAFWRAYVEGIGTALDGRRADLPTLLRSGGFVIDLPDAKAHEVLDAIAEIVGEPFCGPYDFGADTIVKRMMGIRSRYAIDLLHVRVPAQALLFYRAIVGLAHNLRSLKASGDFRPFMREAMAAVRPTEPSGP